MNKRYSIVFENNTFPAKYKGKGSSVFTKELEEINSYKTLKSIYSYMIHNNLYSVNNFYEFFKPCIVEIKTEKKGDNFPIVVEKTFTKLGLQETYDMYKEYINEMRNEYISKNPNTSVDFEKLPESVEYYMNY